MRCMSCGQELTTGGCVNYACPSRAIATSRGNPANDIHNNKTGIPQLERECRDLRIFRDKWKADAERLAERWIEYGYCCDGPKEPIPFKVTHDADCPLALHQLLIEEDTK